MPGRARAQRVISRTSSRLQGQLHRLPALGKQVVHRGHHERRRSQVRGDDQLSRIQARQSVVGARSRRRAGHRHRDAQFRQRRRGYRHPHLQGTRGILGHLAAAQVESRRGHVVVLDRQHVTGIRAQRVTAAAAKSKGQGLRILIFGIVGNAHLDDRLPAAHSQGCHSGQRGMVAAANAGAAYHAILQPKFAARRGRRRNRHSHGPRILHHRARRAGEPDLRKVVVLDRQRVAYRRGFEVLAGSRALQGQHYFLIVFVRHIVNNGQRDARHRQRFGNGHRSGKRGVIRSRSGAARHLVSDRKPPARGRPTGLYADRDRSRTFRHRTARCRECHRQRIRRKIVITDLQSVSRLRGQGVTGPRSQGKYRFLHTLPIQILHLGYPQHDRPGIAGDLQLIIRGRARQNARRHRRQRIVARTARHGAAAHGQRRPEGVRCRGRHGNRDRMRAGIFSYRSAGCGKAKARRVVVLYRHLMAGLGADRVSGRGFGVSQQPQHQSPVGVHHVVAVQRQLDAGRVHADGHWHRSGRQHIVRARFGGGTGADTFAGRAVAHGKRRLRRRGDTQGD